MLHGSKGVEKPNENVGLDDDETMGVEADDVAAPPESDDEAWKRNTRLLLYSFAVSGVYVSNIR